MSIMHDWEEHPLELPERLEPASRPLERVNKDIYLSSITSIEGYNHAVIFCDSYGEYKWQYGMKTKDDVLGVCKIWFAEKDVRRECTPQRELKRCLAINLGFATDLNTYYSSASSYMDLNDFEKVHSGGSSDSYILRSMYSPQVYMEIKREDFFKSLLSKRSDKLLVKARALVARIEEDLSRPNDNRVKGLTNGIDPNKPPNKDAAMSRVDRQQS